VAGIENEIPYPVARVVTDIEAALRRKSFHDRIAETLAADPDWKQARPRRLPPAAEITYRALRNSSTRRVSSAVASGS
jgi:hypothetical protein